MFKIISSCLFVDNQITVPGLDESTAYLVSTNLHYYDDSVEFMYSEVMSNYGDLLVSLIEFMFHQ